VPTSAVCIGQNLTINANGQLQMAPWSVPNLLFDVLAQSSGDGPIVETQYPPGKLLIEQQLTWTDNTPVGYGILIRVIRRWKQWVVSNPNAIEFNDRWTWAINAPADVPSTSGLYNGQCGSSGDLGTNTIAQPDPGVFYHWWGTGSADEWVWETLNVGDTINFWYRCYVWTPPPWSDNANMNNPQFVAAVGWTRIQIWGFPQQGALVPG
jgi:hypothetical protein